MQFLGYVAFNHVTNDFLSSVHRTTYGTRRCYVGRPELALKFKTIRNALDSFKDSPRSPQMVALKLFEDSTKFYLVKPEVA